MAALTAGVKAPDITLPVLGGGTFSLREALAKGPVVAAFFKVSCPTCQYGLPYVERMFRGLRDATVVGISQNPAKDTAAFARQFEITFPLLLDDTHSYPVSNAYGLTNVPTTFLIGEDGSIENSSVGWVKADMDEIYRRLAGREGNRLSPQAAPASLFLPGEDVRDFRAG